MRTFIQLVLLVLATALVGGEWDERKYELCFIPSSSTMSCSGMGIAQPPSGFWPDIVVLYLANDAVTELHSNALSGFPSVYLLYLQDNRISQFDLRVFSVMPELTFLFLDNNLISSITDATGVRLSKLSYLHLSNNQISSLDPDLLSAAPNLQTLYLDNNPLVVPDGQPILSNNPVVEVLHLQRESSLGQLGPQSLQGLPALKEVHLDDAGISDVTGAFLSNTQLDVVSLQGNLITELKPESFAATGNVTAVWLGGNPLTRVHVSALHKVLAAGGSVGIQDTPLACACAYDSLYWWAKGAGVTVIADCTGAAQPCSFL